MNNSYIIRVEELINRLKNALQQFLLNEKALLIQDAHEETISTSLISHLKQEFSDFQYAIDGQYDKRIINSELYRKHIDVLVDRLPKSKIPKNLLEGQKIIKKKILPDIIFHDRDSSNHNFLVIELKKSQNKNKDERRFDLIKLEEMTSGDLHYSYGVFIDFFTGDEFRDDKPYTLIVIKNGKLQKMY